MRTTDNHLRPVLNDRFWSKVRYTPGCWIWTASTNHQGYGEFKYSGQNRRAHRMAYLALCGEIPEDYTIDHLCRMKLCVRPDHLEAVTNEENMRRGQPFREVKTHCPQGHLYDDANTYKIHRRGGWERGCRRCRRDAGTRYYRKISGS